MNVRRVLVYVQHLLGIGHLKRATLIAHALAAYGHETILVSGGVPVADIELGKAALHQLTPVRSTADFSCLIDKNDRPVDDAFMTARRDELLAVAQAFRPEVIITELFPFGRRQLRFELLALLEDARSSPQPPLIIASVRDILHARRKPERVREALQWFEQYYDYLLIHADPAVVTLDVSLPAVIEITDRVRYTGYVVGPAAAPVPPTGQVHGDVVVSAGGGAVGNLLLRAALEAKSESALRDLTWRFLVGYGMPDGELNSLRDAGLSGVVIERARPDFPALLASGALSISQCGYNTMMDVLRAGIPAVVVPFVGNDETEQTTRAEIWAARGAVTALTPGDLTPATLANAVNEAVAAPRYDISNVNFDGASRTAALVAELVATRAGAV